MYQTKQEQHHTKHQHVYPLPSYHRDHFYWCSIIAEIVTKATKTTTASATATTAEAAASATSTARAREGPEAATTKATTTIAVATVDLSL
jgi:hypothetical protein